MRSGPSRNGSSPYLTPFAPRDTCMSTLSPRTAPVLSLSRCHPRGSIPSPLSAAHHSLSPRPSSYNDQCRRPSHRPVGRATHNAQINVISTCHHLTCRSAGVQQNWRARAQRIFTISRAVFRFCTCAPVMNRACVHGKANEILRIKEQDEPQKRNVNELELDKRLCSD